MTSKIQSLSPKHFTRPFQYGWKREVVFGAMENNNNPSKNAKVCYISPTGKNRTKREIHCNLKDDDLDINMFSFTKKPLGVDEENVRFASEKGYIKQNNRINSILGDVASRNVNKYFIDCGCVFRPVRSKRVS